MEEMERYLHRLITRHRSATKEGKPAQYIPELARQNPDALAITAVTTEGRTYGAGECPGYFTLQSIAKVITLIVALMDRGEEAIFHQVGMEPTGDPFDSLYKMELTAGEKLRKPLNPMINAGAMVVCSLVRGNTLDERIQRIIHVIKEMSGNPEVHIDWSVYESERETADRNRALAYILKEYHMIQRVEETLELYFQQSSISVRCEDLARIGLCLAQNGRNVDGKQVIPESVARIVKTFMVTCGMYDQSGEFAIRVGIPAKSGVSGSIVAAIPFRMGIGIIGPALNERGNSVAGLRILRDLSMEWNLSIF
ncbi:glutaminase A [Mechercharimyces sp. CAU 1602]|uniref:glutaminase A n=1 Tax=Mechercharimyces sp. CAU 1602 TaxID=2973933 RepID=UPI0021622C99|nr:glutaminase A [Mechercharimyces sp. CAU 1602]MCS1350141.1 glutaminase A [Mechercharimyces sp. CAU 1602]